MALCDSKATISVCSGADCGGGGGLSDCQNAGKGYIATFGYYDANTLTCP